MIGAHAFRTLRATKGTAAAAFVALLALAAPGGASAQRASTESYLAPKLMLGLGGEADVGPGEDDLEPGYGFGLFYGAPLHENFVLGGQFSLFSWQTDGAEDLDFDRSLLFDLSLVPMGRVQASRDLEVYFALPIGFTLNSIGEDEFLGGEVGTGVGFNVAFMLGLRFSVGRSIALLAEVGYCLHSFEHEVEVGPLSTDVDVDLDYIALNLGFSFDL